MFPTVIRELLDMRRNVALTVIRELLDVTRNVASLEIGDIPHTSNKLNWVNPIRPGVPKFLQSVVVTSPAGVMMHPLRW